MGRRPIYAGRDSITALAHGWWGRSGLTVRWTVGSPAEAVLSRDAVVYTSMVTAAVKDSAGAETTMKFVWTGLFVREGGAWKIQTEAHVAPPPEPAPVAPAKPTGARR